MTLEYLGDIRVLVDLCLKMLFMVSGEFGHLPEYREVTGNPRGAYGP